MYATVVTKSPLTIRVPGAATACSADIIDPYPQSVSGDTNGTLGEVSGITGVSASYMSAGNIYASVSSSGGWHVNFYKQKARTTKIGHTANFTADGDVAITADGSSGLGGTVTIANYATIAADTDIAISIFTYTPVVGDLVSIDVRTPRKPLVRGKA